jgi:uncharacterized protein (DUF427 family)
MNRVQPQAGQESVWDYPRPPRVESTISLIRVVFNDVEIARTKEAFRVLETSHPPAVYIPRADVLLQYLHPSARRTFCEFKGEATYWSINVNGRVSRDAAWSYRNPSPGFEQIRDHLAFYASRVDACYIDDEQVVAQEGDFYGGWITSRIVGPFKGAPGTWGW